MEGVAVLTVRSAAVLGRRAVTRGVVLTISITTRTTQRGEREGGPGISNTRRQTRDMSRDGDDDDVHVTLHVTLPTSRHMSPVTHKPCYPSPDKDLNLSSPLAFRSQINIFKMEIIVQNAPGRRWRHWTAAAEW